MTTTAAQSQPTTTKVKTVCVCIDIDKELWAKFSKYCDKKYGNRHKTKKVEQLIQKYMKKHTTNSKKK